MNNKHNLLHKPRLQTLEDEEEEEEEWKERKKEG
jgi:hypothetical protein